MRFSAPVYHLKWRAKQLVRKENIALHVALDRIARAEGFANWGLLARRWAQEAALPGDVLDQFAPGDFVLLGARPGHGKTLMGLRILRDAMRAGRRSCFFTLEYTQAEVETRLARLGGIGRVGKDPLEIVTSEDISAAYIVSHMTDAPRGSVAVIDYLQLLDQQRHKPALAEQLSQLQAFACRTGVILIFISQIDRTFSSDRKTMPGMEDVRLPNPVPFELFSKACFLHDGKLRFQVLTDL
ncbi:MAG: DNA helicase [Rhodobacteraceae bacterium]|nr:DNA helicase [Paracoccaceae bacterium]